MVASISAQPTGPRYPGGRGLRHPPTGKGFTAEHVHWHRMVGGKLVERWAVRDELGTLIQLGIIDPPGRFKADESD
jgi:hypothetical protein